MAGSHTHSLNTRLQSLSSQNTSLAQEVDEMTEALSYHQQEKPDPATAIRDILRKEIDGSVWQHGGEGKVTKYTSCKDLQNQYGLKAKKTSKSQRPREGGAAIKPLRDKSSRTGKPSVSDETRRKTSRKPKNSAKDNLKEADGLDQLSLSVRGRAGNSRSSHCTDDTFIIESISTATAQGQSLPDVDTALTGTSHSGEGTLSRPSSLQSSGDNHCKLARGCNILPGKLPQKLDPGNGTERHEVPNLEDDSRIEIQVTAESGDRAGEKRAAVTKPRSAVCSPDVKSWLKSLHLLDLETYERVFARHGLTMEDVCHLTKEKLCGMSVKNVGVQNKIMSGVLKMKRQQQHTTAKPHSASYLRRPPEGDQAEGKDNFTEKVVHQPSQHFHPTSGSKVTSSHENRSASIRGAKAVPGRKLHASTDRDGTNMGPVEYRSPARPSSLVSRPASAREVTQRPFKGRGSNRPVSASTIHGVGAKAQHNISSQSKGALSPKDNVDISCGGGSSSRSRNRSARYMRSPGRSPGVSESPESGLTDLLYVKTIQHTPTSDDREVPASSEDIDETGNYFVDDEVSMNLTDSAQEVSHENGTPPDIAEQKLKEVEMQIQSLQENLSSPAALKMIGQLQVQLKAVQREIIKDKRKAKRVLQIDLCNQQPTAANTEGEDPAEANQTAGGTTVLNQLESSGELETSPEFEAEFSRPPPGLKTRPVTSFKLSAGTGKMTGVRASSVGLRQSSGLQKQPGVASMSMTKSELLKEVRKQKDQHRKEIRHLESELSRLKHKDPLRTFEIPVKDISFDDSSLLGEGAFSQVFHGSYQGSEVAVKRLRVPLSAQDKNYFTAEVSLLQDLRHPRVVLLLGVCTTSHLPVMVLEYMARGSLYHHLHNSDRSGLDHAEFYQIARDVALGMNYLHLHRPPVLHLDLKSMNVLLTTHLRAKIADFGFSKLRHDADMASGKTRDEGHTKGTPAWMAPELLSGGIISAKCDVYSFGIVMWEMLTRRQPYEGCSVFQVLERVRQQKRPEINPDKCPPELQQLISKCWEHNPAKRPSFKDILKLLEDLHFPQEWRLLFDAAGIPQEALNDIQSTQTLINIVTHTIEQSNGDGTETADAIGVTCNMDGQNTDRPAFVPRLHLCSTSSEDELKLPAPKKGDELPSRSKKTPFEPMHISLAWSEDLGVQNSKRIAHPAIPPLRMSLLEDGSTPEEPDPESLKPISFLEELKQGAQNLKAVPAKESQTAEDSKHVAERPEIRASQLLRQKQRLKSALHPHPNQLKDLRDISQEQIDSLAALLRKAVQERRVALQVMGDGHTSTDNLDSANDSGWSVSQD